MMQCYQYAMPVCHFQNIIQGTGKGLVLGFYESPNGYELTKSANIFNEKCDGNLKRLLSL